ncbi:class I SAM-dependent methyltransferase [Sphingopyxis fribergensis]
MGFISTFAKANIRVSQAIESLLPESLRRDGGRTYREIYAPQALEQGPLIYDVGGGSQPFASLEDKERFDLRVVGLDISAEELALAPAGVYDRAIAADLCTYVGDGDADVVICQATLEHVPDGPGAMRAIATILKPGGRAFLFAPSRNALFARLNLLLPEGVKKKILFALFPAKALGHDGFPAFYNGCTPNEIERSAHLNGLVIEKRALFWVSSYFMAFVPAYLAWRLFQGASFLARGQNAAETFIYILRKPISGDSAA